MSGTSASLTLPIGVVIAGPIITLVVGALIVVAIFRSAPSITGAPQTAVPFTPTITLTLLPTNTEAPTSTPTPLPPIKVTVQANDTCFGLAAQFGITDINQIKLETGKSANCESLSLGQVLLIPQPTPTPQPASTATMNAIKETEAACSFDTYTVVEGDSLVGIADLYNVSMDAIKRWNSEKYSFMNDQVLIGMVLRIPLCEREPTPGASPTPTTPPPYPALNLLTPRDGTIYGLSDNEIALQWAAGVTLRENEVYQVTIEDISVPDSEKVVRYIKEQRLLVPAELKPTDGKMHIYRWSVMVVRKTGTTDAGNTVYVTAGLMSERRVFAWGGTGSPAETTPTT